LLDGQRLPSIFFRPFFVFFLDNQVVCWFQ
jgi:hypothetical protein